MNEYNFHALVDLYIEASNPSRHRCLFASVDLRLQGQRKRGCGVENPGVCGVLDSPERGREPGHFCHVEMG